jgi:hypothetical protein
LELALYLVIAKDKAPTTLKLDPFRMIFGGFDRIGKKQDLPLSEDAFSDVKC